MNMVVIKHPNDNGKYIFRVPDDVELDVGTMVLCETARGINPGICATGTFRADPEIICPMWGTQPKGLKRILSHLIQNNLEWPDEPEPETKYDEDEEP